ncbi:MAG: M48 family peptidase, partial [Aliifodinibius sp.]|nr:M48 family peptidase [Fodinibius sp.]NIV14031.1 M48 family peptidase [Fodinibius sp.]NIY27868.1 M48 family peptidase [Fodinibius sp.]
MNIFAVIILATLTIDFILNLVSDYLNLKSLDTGLPGEFQGVYDEETYEKSQRYTKERTKFGILTSIFNLGLLLFFWFAGGFQWLDEIVRSWELGVIWTGLVYIG